ncbi:MAG TPA: hypothetical protein VNV85_13040 [Puia sp.]|nr:hypothetical protein [Puia sp.]
MADVQISGFTIIRNAIINDYPVVEAITSILPVVDEMIVLVGDSEDDTEALIRGINNAKIRIHHSVWDKSLRKGGAVLAAETNKAFQLIDPQSTWAFYIQADEVVHEKYHQSILDAAEKYKDASRVDGLLFKYLHFYGMYAYVADSRKWYSHEVRIIRNNKEIKSYRDAQGFRKNTDKLLVKAIDAYIYHYGWVKNPFQMKKKLNNVSMYWRTDEEWKQYISSGDVFDFSDFDSIEKFTGSHPAVMLNRIREQNWNLELNPSQKRLSVKNKLLQLFEKKTGIRLFDFRNYKTL